MTIRRRRRLGIVLVVVLSAIAAAVIAAPAPTPPAPMTTCLAPPITFAAGGPIPDACPNPVVFAGSGSADVTVSNMGSGSLVLTGYTPPNAPFTVSWGSDCPAGSCTLSAPAHNQTTLHVDYAPSTMGPHMDKATLATSVGPYDVVLMGSTAKVPGMIVVNPQVVNLGATAPFGVATMTVTVTNMGSGSAMLMGNSVIADGHWQVDWDAATCPSGSCTLGSGSGSTSFIATFSATSQGMFDTSTTILNDTGTNPIVMLNGSGSGSVSQDLTVIGNPNLDFGIQNVGFASSKVSFDLANTGNVDLPVISIVPMGGSGNPWVIEDPSIGLATSTTRTIFVSCKPTAAGSYDDLLVITPPSGTTVHSTANFAMHCEAVDGGVHPAPSPIALGEIRVGTAVSPVVVTLSGSGAPIDITSGPSLTGTNPALSVSAATPSTITSTQAASFTLAVDTTAEDLDLTDTISVTAGTGLAIQVSGKITTPAITHTNDLDLGTFCIGEPTPTATATFTASGTASILMTRPTLALGAASPFSATYTAPVETAYATGYRLVAGTSATIELHTNDHAGVGDVGDTLTWPSDMPGQPMAVTTLAAHFVDAGAAIAPGSIDFGPVAVHLTSPPHTISLQNCGDTPIDLARATISSPVFRDVSTAALPSSLASGQVAKIDVMFVPPKAGGFQATLSVVASTGTLTAVLTGIGLGGADSAGDRTGFYACSCRTADPATGAPIVLAIAGVLFRRRRRK